MFKFLTYSSAFGVVLVLGLLIFSLLEGSQVALQQYPVLLTADWSPNTEEFGIWVPVMGTVVTSLIALVIATPLALAVAFCLTEFMPMVLRKPIRIAIELLAAIPSIIYGMWGLIVFVPFFRTWIQPTLAEWLSPIPWIGIFFTSPAYAYGTSVLTAAIILSLMILPFITSVIQEVFATVPPLLKESAYGLGATRWEVCRSVLLPYSRVGIVGAVTLGLGRAVGETMAVSLVIGSASRLSPSLLASGNSITSALANQFQEATTPLEISALLTLGLLLFCITFIILMLTKYWMYMMQRRGGQ